MLFDDSKSESRVLSSVRLATLIGPILALLEGPHQRQLK